jgi:hypothetical protein
MRIIITGGTGLIGKPLTAALLEDGHEVIVLSRSPTKHEDDMPEGTRLYKWDAETSTNWQLFVEETDAIVNFAGASIAGDGFPPDRWTDERKRVILDSRLDAGRAVVQAFEKAENKPKVLIQSSAVGYYGRHTEDKVLDETAHPGGDFLARVCREWEKVTDPVVDMGVRRCITRTGIVLSMEGGALPNLVLPFKFFAGGPMGSGKQWYPWIHIEDEVRAIKFLLENEEAQGVYNLSAPNPVQNKELAKIIGKEMGRPWFVPAPAFALKTALGEVSTVVLDGQRAIPDKLQKEGFTFAYPHAEEAIDDLL